MPRAKTKDNLGVDEIIPYGHYFKGRIKEL